MNAMIKNPMQTQMRETDQICEIHGERMLEVIGRSFCKSCSLEALKKANSEGEREKDFSKSQTEKRINNAMIPDRHKHCSFENYRTDHAGQTYAKNECSKFFKDFVNQKQRNLIMVGRTGTGKTHLASALARNLLAKRQNIRYITSEDMANRIAEAWNNKQSGETESSVIARFVAFDLLILDEYGLHDQHERMLTLVHKVLYARYNARKPTMLISNFTKTQLEANLGDRLWSRFQEDQSTMIECDWTDQRFYKQVAV